MILVGRVSMLACSPRHPMPIKEDQIHAEEKSEQEKREQEADERLTKKTYLYI